MTSQATDAKKRNTWLWLALVVTAALTIWTSFQPDDEDADNLVSPIVRTDQRVANLPSKIMTQQSASTITQTSKNQSIWQVLNREAPTKNASDLFPVHSWAVISASPKTKPLPPPPPVAPPTPFTYMGKMEDSPKGTLIFLMANNKVYSVVKGENIDAFWRLDGEDTYQLKFTFLPLNLPQTLSKSQPLITPELPSAAASAVN